MTKKVHTLIIGGGMIGRLVQRHIPDSLILDWGNPPKTSEPPRTLGAVYLWAPVADLTCERFDVVTTIDAQEPTPEGIRAYKERVGKLHEIETRPDAVAAQFQHESYGFRIVRFPPPTFIEYRAHVLSIDAVEHTATLRTGEVYEYQHLVSTIPMPALIRMSGMLTRRYGHIGFPSTPIYVRVVQGASTATSLRVDYRTTDREYRRTDHLDGSRHFEYGEPVPDLHTVKLVPGRIHDIYGAAEIAAFCERHDIFCIGRYARWDSDELTHISDNRIAMWAIRRRKQSW